MVTTSTSRTADAPVVVGFDGTTHSMAALHFGISESLQRTAPLRVVHVSPHSRTPFLDLPMLADVIASDRRSVEALVRDAVEGQAPGLNVEVTMGDGSPAERLVELSRDAHLVVLGRDSKHSLERLLTRATTAAIASRTIVPTVVVPADWTARRIAGGRLVVGFRAPGHAGALLDAAFERASRYGAEIQVVHAWNLPDTFAARVEVPTHADTRQREERGAVAAALASWRHAYPDVRVAIEVVQGDASEALVGASAEADLLLLLRRSSRLEGHHLGRVANAVLGRAQCPVEIVPATNDVALLEVERDGTILR